MTRQYCSLEKKNVSVAGHERLLCCQCVALGQKGRRIQDHTYAFQVRSLRGYVIGFSVHLLLINCYGWIPGCQSNPPLVLVLF